MGYLNWIRNDIPYNTSNRSSTHSLIMTSIEKAYNLNMKNNEEFRKKEEQRFPRIEIPLDILYKSFEKKKKS